MSLRLGSRLCEFAIGAMALLVLSSASLAASADAVVTVSMQSTTVSGVIEIAAQHERTGGKRADFKTLMATVPARGIAPATRTTGRVRLSYSVLANLVAPSAQTDLPHPTVKAGTVLYDCRRIVPCPTSRLVYRTTKDAVLDQSCSYAFLSIGLCSQVVPIVAEQVGPSDLGGQNHLLTDTTVSFPDGGRERLPVEVADSGTPGRARTPIVRSSDR